MNVSKSVCPVSQFLCSVLCLCVSTSYRIPIISIFLISFFGVFSCQAANRFFVQRKQKKMAQNATSIGVLLPRIHSNKLSIMGQNAADRLTDRQTASH